MPPEVETTAIRLTSAGASTLCRPRPALTTGIVSSDMVRFAGAGLGAMVLVRALTMGPIPSPDHPMRPFGVVEYVSPPEWAVSLSASSMVGGRVLPRREGEATGRAAEGLLVLDLPLSSSSAPS